MNECQCQKKRKHREETEYRALINRLNRIEGQVRGIKSMLENDAYCTDILIQVSAVSAALNAFNKELLSCHLHACVRRITKALDDAGLKFTVSLENKTVTVDGCEHCLKTALSELEDLGFTPSVS